MLIITLIVLSLIVYAALLAFTFSTGRNTVRAREHGWKGRFVAAPKLGLLGVVFLFGLISLIYTLYLIGTATIRPSFFDRPDFAMRSLRAWMGFTFYSAIALIFIIPIHSWQIRIKHLPTPISKLKALALVTLKTAIPCILFCLALADFYLGEQGFLYKFNYWPD